MPRQAIMLDSTSGYPRTEGREAPRFLFDNDVVGMGLRRGVGVRGYLRSGLGLMHMYSDLRVLIGVME